jgi:hypothetical protein
MQAVIAGTFGTCWPHKRMASSWQARRCADVPEKARALETPPHLSRCRENATHDQEREAG